VFKNSKLFFWTIEILAVALIIYLGTKLGFLFTPVTTLFATVFIPFIVAGFLYYVFNPMLDFFERKFKIKRGLGILLIFAVIIGLIAFGIVALVPRLVEQLTGLISTSAKVFPQLQEWLEKLAKRPEFKGVDFDALISNLNLSYMDILKNLLDGVTGSFSSIAGTVGKVAMGAVLVPILLLYMLKDGKRLLPYVQETILRTDKLGIVQLLHDMNKTISKYISGAALDCSIIFVLIFIAYTILGIPYALLFALFAGITNLIPYLGPWIGMIPMVLTVVFDDWKKAVIGIIIVQVIQWVDGNIIYPKVVGSAVNVHPVTIMILMLVASSLGGLVGMLIAVPAYSLVKEVVKFCVKLWDKYHQHKLVV
jgi:predicted PurR-regulated permease PerM